MGYYVETINKKEVKIDMFLKQKLDFVRKKQKKDFDMLLLIDGDEGEGKSTLSFIIGWYLADGKLTMNNLAEGTDDAIKKLEILPDQSVLIIDEGSLTFSSKDTMKKENKQLMKILNVIRQKRMVLIIVAPTFFELERYIAYRRSSCLIHVYVDKHDSRGQFSYFNNPTKKRLYTIGKRNYGSYAYPPATFVGRFPDFKLPFDEEYQKLKRKSLMEALHPERKEKPLTPEMVMDQYVGQCRDNYPEITKEVLAKVFSCSLKTIYNAHQRYKAETLEKV